MHPCSLRRALLPALAAALLLPTAAAHATPPGANGPLLGQFGESFDYAVLDPAKDPDDNAAPAIWGGGTMLGTLRSSPDGEHVAYVSIDDNRIAVADVADGGHERLIGGTADARGLAFSPDGQTIAFSANNKVLTVPADGSAAPTQVGSDLQQAWELDWGANGAGIVVSAEGANGTNDLYAVDPATGATTPLTATGNEDETAVSFAPDGERLVVASDPTAPGADNHLDVMGAAGTGRHALVTEAGVNQPQWSPDGTRIAFLTDAGAQGEDVATIKPDGAQRHPVAAMGAISLSWPIAAGTGDKLPSADFAVAPAQPYTNGDTTFTDTSVDPDGSIASQAWDLDGDGQYDDATGPVAHLVFTTPGAHTIGLKVRDDRNAAATVTKSIDVLVGGRPGARFTVDPATPTINEAATFTAAPNDDPHARVLHHQWDFDGDGTWDADTGVERTVQHTYTSTGPVTAKLRVTDAEGDTDTTSVALTVRDVVRCGREQVGRLVLDGCLVVKGTRRIAPQGVTINGFKLDATDAAVPAIDVAQYRAAAVPKAQAGAILDGSAPIPSTGESVPVTSSCGEAVGTSKFALSGFKDDDKSAPFTLADGMTFAGMRARDSGSLDFGDGTAKFAFAGLFPRLLLNWTAEGRGTYAVAPDCKDDHLTVRLGSFVSRVIQFPEIRLERTGTNRWDGTVDMTVKGFKAITTTVTAIDGSVRAMTLNIGDAPILPGAMLHAGSVTLRLDKGYEELVGRGSLTTTPRLFGKDFLAVEGSLSLGRDGLKTYGVAKVVGVDVGWVTAEINTTEGYASLDAEADISLGPAHVEGELSGYVQPLKFTAELYGSAEAGIDGIGHIGVDGLVSTKGIAACGHVSFGVFGSASPGFSYRWGDTWPKVFLSSCDFGDLRVPRATGATASAAASHRVRTVTVPAGQRAVVIVARGTRAGRAPRVALIGPHGQRITSKANGKATKQGRFLVIPNKQDGTTNIMVMKPAAGTWRVKPLGGAAVKQVGTATALPKVSVKVVRKGKTLRWTLRSIKGQSVKLVEVHADGTTRALKTTNKAKGIMKYVPAAGAKTIVAMVSQDGLPRERRTVVKLSKTTKK
ncbi:MAG TPA: PKD domain-containing protein [Baekduia sp.]